MLARTIHVNIDFKCVINLHVDLQAWRMFMIMFEKLDQEVGI
jgi:hypothetical protein